MLAISSSLLFNCYYLHSQRELTKASYLHKDDNLTNNKKLKSNKLVIESK